MKKKIATISIRGNDLIVKYIDSNGITSEWIIPTNEDSSAHVLNNLKKELKEAGY